MVEVENKIQRYTSYKNSGVEWLGEIPEHWEVLANKFIFNLKKNQVGKKSNDYDLLSLTLRGIVIRNIEDGGKFPAEFDTYQEVKKGDFVFCLFDVEETPRCVGLSKYDGMITGAYTVMQPFDNFDRGFLYYFYLNLDTDKRMKPLYTGLRNTISKDNFFSFKTFIPPLPEQTAIAQFLDDKTTKIDQAIAIKQQQIALLKERKQILIHKAVTRGLDDSVALKDSGVEWIGEIPEHWEVKRLKFLGSLFAGLTGKSGEDFSKDYKDGFKKFIPFTSIFKSAEINEDNHQYVKVSNSETQNEIKSGDILFLMSSETLDDIGKTSIYLGTENELYLNSFCKVFRIKDNNIDAVFLNHTLQSKNYRHYFSLKGRGFTRINIKQEFVLDMFILIPPLSEQKEIAQYIETASAKIDTAIGFKEQEIEKLQEYKSSLINSVVTGKVKVC